jgi:hypothetical protein
MSRSSSHDPIESMDLANMRQNGVPSLAVQCHQCRHRVIVNADHWPGGLTVKSFEPRMVCTRGHRRGCQAELAGASPVADMTRLAIQGSGC